MSNLSKQSWLDRAKETHRFHINKKREHIRWRLSDTAKILKRSIGSISEDILISSWCKTHENQLKRFDYAKDALKFIHKKEFDIELNEEK